uniref:Uncharacterized protein n=1 Tax=Arundo donax TaxID=35708 RepID=A0A0A9B779_ARUDO
MVCKANKGHLAKLELALVKHHM